MTRKLATSFHCPTEFTLDLLGGKWKTVILCYLSERACRYSELRKLLPRLSEKMLTERLKELVATGLVVIEKSNGKEIRGSYALSPRGHALRSLLRHMYDWGDQHADDYGVVVGHPLKSARAKLESNVGRRSRSKI